MTQQTNLKQKTKRLIPKPFKKLLLPLLTLWKRVRKGNFKAIRYVSLMREVTKDNLVLGVFYAYGAEVEGDIAEFGTGETSVTLVTAMRLFDGISGTKPKNLYLFDSFEGLPSSESSVDKETIHIKSGVWGPGACKWGNKDQLKKLCIKELPEERVLIYDGWFKDTLPQLPPDTKFAMLHIDCDLYQSAIEVLDIVFSKRFLSWGGVIFFDDWNSNRASPNFGERKAWSEIVDKYAIVYSDGGDYSWNGHKFIVHTYKVIR